MQVFSGCRRLVFWIQQQEEPLPSTLTARGRGLLQCRWELCVESEKRFWDHSSPVGGGRLRIYFRFFYLVAQRSSCAKYLPCHLAKRAAPHLMVLPSCRGCKYLGEEVYFVYRKWS